MIYQILIDRFNGGWISPPTNKNDFLGGNLWGIQEKLDYIQSLGATHIWLSPFFKSEAYHGYHTSDYEQIDSHFGSWSNLISLVSAAHEKGLRIIADFVPNHCHSCHPFFQDAINNPTSSRYREWFYFKDDFSSECACFFGYPELPKLNLENQETAKYFIQVGERLTNIGVDGFRIDHAVGIPMSFLRKFRDRMHELNPDTFVFGEVWACNMPRKYFKTLHFKSIWKKMYYWVFGIKQEAIQLDYKDVLDGVLDFEFQGLLLDEIESGKRLINNTHLTKRLNKHFSNYSFNTLMPIPFLDNHDMDRFLFTCHGDDSLLEEALSIMKKYGKQYVLYYGTENRMQNTETIINAEPYADLRVREPMDWSNIK